MGPTRRPHPTRLSPLRDDYDIIIEAHEVAVERGDSLYRDPTSGLMVLTVSAHLDRGSCCSSGCRHCPYIETGDPET